MIGRPVLVRAVERALRENPIAVLLGPRQCGKTTLARVIAARRRAEIFDLEDPADLARIESPLEAFEGLSGLVVIDEVQRAPGVFEVLRVLADRPRRRARFLLLGSASPGLVRGVSETLAGRAAMIEMGGFDLSETGSGIFRRLWLRGAFPRSFLARGDAASLRWRNDLVRTLLERDVPQLGISIPSPALRRFWTMVAHYHGQRWNAAEFARSIGRSEGTARAYLDLLTGVFLVRQLPPWFENVGKRQVKAPKVYVRDSGLLHALLGLDGARALARHPKVGASWEGFALEQVLSLHRPAEAYYWATLAGAEIDLLLPRGGRRVGFEFKSAEAPRMTRSIRSALDTLGLDRVFVVHPGRRSYRIDERVEALSILDLPRSLPRRGRVR